MLSDFFYSFWPQVQTALQYEPLYNINAVKNGVKKLKPRVIMARLWYLFKKNSSYYLLGWLFSPPEAM